MAKQSARAQADGSLMKMDLEAAVQRNLDDIVEKARDWALLNGLTMRPKSKLEADSTDRLEFVPFTLLPSKFPSAAYAEAFDIQPIVNELIHRVSQDGDFLREALAETVRVDSFTRRLFELHEASLDAQNRQTVSLGLLRSDYMLDEVESINGWTAASEPRCKQVEVNTIASGQGWIGTACHRLHRYVLEELDRGDCCARTPDNKPLEGLCAGILEAWRIYASPSAIILFVVEETTLHIGDQRFHEYELRRLEPRLRVLRRTLSQLAHVSDLIETDSRLIVDGQEVAVVYFRSGYAPEQYPGEAEWQAREVIEKSKAIKCPTIAYQLAGTKKVQQMLAEDGCLERFLDKKDCRQLRRLFTGLYSLDIGTAGNAAIDLALARPSDFVLKPQREGGANNLFGADLSRKLLAMRDTPERTAWILMDRIRPPVQRNYVVRPCDNGGGGFADVTSELGIFGVVIGDGERILRNDAVGHTLRTKFAECNEGGVSSGYGACDSPFLL